MSAEPQPQMIDVDTAGSRRAIATLVSPGSAPGLMWLPGFKSDMLSTKASALAEWAAARGLASTRFDYSGHGQSGGRFEDGTIGRWLEEAAAVFTRLTQGPQIVVGSSMGGYIALLLLKRLLRDAPADAARIKGLMLIAPAWDMTQELMWNRFADDTKIEIEATGVWLRPSAYGEPYPITRGLIEDGRNNLIGSAPWNPGRPVHILHGKLDPDVPWQHTVALESILEGDWTHTTWVEDGEHRLSRPEDIELMFKAIGEMTGDAPPRA
ncbi:MAG: alpha/beta fold hydrolase [Hyphomicrobiaceae bacterium]